MNKPEPIRILYMEDDPGTARLVQKRLERAGYAVDLAYNGEQGLSMYDVAAYDVVAADHLMPGIEGLEVVRLLAARGPLPPTIIVTGEGNEHIAVEAMKLGVSDYIVKDMAGRFLELLPSVIERALQQQRLVEEREQALEALQESETRYRSLFNDTPVGLYRTTPDGQILNANPFLVEMLGYPDRESLLGADAIDLYVDPEDRMRWQALVDEGDGIVRDFEAQLRRHDGQTIWIQDTARAIRDDDGQLLYYDGALEDITERKRAEEALAWQAEVDAAIAELSQMLISPATIEGISLLVLEQAQHLTGSAFGFVGYIDPQTGYLVSPTLTAGIWDACQVEDKDVVFEEYTGLWGWVLKNRKPLLTNTPADDPRSSGTPPGHLPIDRFLSAPAIIGGELVGQVAVANSNRDYTERDLVLVEQLAWLFALAIMRRRAEETLRQRTAELQARNEELDAFAHTVAHDLKGPLSVLTGYAEFLTEYSSSMPLEEIEASLHQIEQGARKMSNIIKELLLLASVRKEEVQAGSLDMARILAEVQQSLNFMIEEYQAEIVLPDRWPLALGYSPWIEEVWMNYLSNALKYGGRPPQVELGATEQPDGTVRFWMRDNGHGLTQEEQARLFMPFSKLHRVRAEGQGLGLSIVRRIIDRLGGQVGVESMPGRGSVFYFTLPAGRLDQE